MVNSQKNTAIQATPLKYGKINVGAGTYICNDVIHCEADATITLLFTEGNISYDMVAGDDRAYRGSFTVVSGTVTYD